MELIPYYNQEQLAARDIEVRLNGEDRARVTELCKRTATVTSVHDEASFQAARRAASELKAAATEINSSKRFCKLPFEAVLSAVEELAKEVLQPVGNEQRRIQALLNNYVEKLEAQAREAERKRAEELRAQQLAHEQQIRAMEAAKQKAEETARKAVDEAERERAKTEAARNELLLAQAELERTLELEVASMEQEPSRGLVPGGRVDHPFKFRLVDAEKTVKAGCIRLLRVELNILACKDSVRSQLEIAPDRDPELPGIEVTRAINVSVKPASKIS
jgi:hypothetical protein